MMNINSLHYKLEQSLGITTISSLSSASIRQFGGKAANLGELNSTGERVPLGIALSKDTLAYFIKSNNIDLTSLERVHTMGMTFIESALRAASDLQRQIIDVIKTSEFPLELRNTLLSELTPWLNKRLAIRSSCIVEDSNAASFAGQYVTILNVHGQEAIFEALRIAGRLSMRDGH